MSTASPFKPYKRKSQKTIAKEKRAKALNNRTPQEMQVFRTCVIGRLMSRLYDKSLQYWHVKLRELAAENASSLGRDPDRDYAIHYNRRQYHHKYEDPLAMIDSRSYCLCINPGIEEYQQRMAEIAEELDEIKDERYEVERFILNFVGINPPREHYERVFGRQLYALIQDRVERYAAVEWDENQEFELVTYVRGNKETIQKMQERIILNLVS